MEQRIIRVLAVSDPGVQVYVDEKKQVLSGFAQGKVQFDVFPWAQYYETMMNVFAGKADYDIVMVAGHLWKRDFVEKGRLAPIGALDQDILPVIAREAQFEGSTYLSPSFCDGHMVVMRKSRLSACGITPAQIITPQDYIEMAHTLGKNAVAMKAHPSEIFTDALPFIRMYGGDAYDVSGAPVCDSDEAVRGLESYCELRRYASDDTADYGNEQVADAISSGKTAMGITWSGQMGVVMGEHCRQPEDLIFSTLSTAWNVTWSFAISAMCTHKELAEALLSYLRSPQVDVEAGAFSGAPVRLSSYKQGMDSYPWYSCQLEMIEKYARPMPDCSRAGERNACLYDEIALAFADKKSPRRAMQDAKERILTIDRT
ncbi:extracellular solute-binding protein [Oscillospiraceae bacterium PP1C4]